MDPDDPAIWTIKTEDRRCYHQIFQNISTSMNGKLSGVQAKNFLSESELSEDDLAHIWILADSDRDGALTEQEFSIAMHLTNLRLQGIELPESLSVN
jgi:hypothetical protein